MSGTGRDANGTAGADTHGLPGGGGQLRVVPGGAAAGGPASARGRVGGGCGRWRPRGKRGGEGGGAAGWLPLARRSWWRTSGGVGGKGMGVEDAALAAPHADRRRPPRRRVPACDRPCPWRCRRGAPVVGAFQRRRWGLRLTPPPPSPPPRLLGGGAPSRGSTLHGSMRPSRPSGGTTAYALRGGPPSSRRRGRPPVSPPPPSPCFFGVPCAAARGGGGRWVASQ